jgi:hypothetical protein
MSKSIANFVKKAASLTGAAAKFSPAVTEGNRILPSKTKDAEFECRLDAGHYNAETKKLNVVLQVNSQAKSPALRDWARKNTTHAKLAEEAFDTSAKDKQAEYSRVLESLAEKAKKNLG